MAEANHLWQCRPFVTTLVHLLGRRRYKDKIKDRICLSFFVSTDSLDFRPLLLSEEDPYFTFWVSQLVPLYDEENFHQKIQKANDWVIKKIPNSFEEERFPLVKKNSYVSSVQNLFALLFLNPRFGRNLCQSLKDSQFRKMQMNKNSVMHEDNTKVVISDNILKFHETDKRKIYREKFYNKVKEVLGDSCG